MVKGCGKALAGELVFYLKPCTGKQNITSWYTKEGWLMPADWARTPNYRCGSSEAGHGCGLFNCKNLRLCENCAVLAGIKW